MYYGRNLLEWDKTKTKNGIHPTSWYSTAEHESWNKDYSAKIINPAFNWASNSWPVISAPDWIQASEAAVRYCMDPRNWLSEEQVFQFEDMKWNTACESAYLAGTEAVFRNVIPNTFWTQPAEESEIVSELPDTEGQKMTYAEAIYEIGKALNVNPVFLASRIVQEQGVGASPLISGEKRFKVTSGPDAGKWIDGGYYNYFNIEATDSEEGDYELIYNNGLSEAYNANPPWNTRFRALYGGAQKATSGYILRGQTSFYMQKFCVDSTSRRCMWGQYMGSLTTPQREAAKAYKAYINGSDRSALETTHLFIIPVYENMPDKPVEAPTKDGNPNYKLGSIYYSHEGKSSGSVADFKTDTTEYTLPNVDSNISSIRFNLQAYAPTTMVSIGSTSGEGSLAVDVAVQYGDNSYSFVSKAENGDTRTYKINVFRYGNIVYGDVNSDGKWDNKDTAIMGSHILGNIKLKGQALEAADINGDGKVNNIDTAIIGAYILGNISNIKQR